MFYCKFKGNALHQNRVTLNLPWNLVTIFVLFVSAMFCLAAPNPIDQEEVSWQVHKALQAQKTTASEPQIFYFHDFEKPVGPEWSNRKTDKTPIEKRCFLGLFGNEEVHLRLEDLPLHEKVTIFFDLFIIRSWDGNGRSGPDVWQLKTDGGPALLYTTFSNSEDNPRNNRQNYPGPYPGGDYPARTGAAEINTLGYGRDTIYRLCYTFNHSGQKIALSFSAQGTQPISDESWGLDDIGIIVYSDLDSRIKHGPEKIENPAITRDDAIQHVLGTLGLPKDQVSVTASQIALPDQVLPGIRSEKTKNPWCVNLENISIKIKDKDRMVTNPYIKSLTVFLSSETGQIMKVISPAPQGDSSIKPFPSLESYERQLLRHSEVFSGLPITTPKVTFMEALQQAIGGAHNAKQIIGYYVLRKRTESFPDADEKAVWVIHLWGIPPWPARGGPGGKPGTVPVAARNHLRSIIDAETGQFWGADTIPQPDSNLFIPIDFNHYRSSPKNPIEVNESKALIEARQNYNDAKDPNEKEHARKAYVAELKEIYGNRISTQIDPKINWNEAQKTVADFHRFMSECNPVGFTIQELKSILGPPTSETKNTLDYGFDQGLDATLCRFQHTDGYITGFRFIPTR